MASTNCNNGNFFHFTLNFYLDQGMSNLQISVNTEKYWPYFQVNGIPLTENGAFLCNGYEFLINFNPSVDFPPELIVLFNKSLWLYVENPIPSPINYANLNKQAKFMFVVDESGGLKNNYQSIALLANYIDSNLNVNNFSNNYYGLTQFGNNCSSENVRTINFNDNGISSPFGNSSSFQNYILSSNISNQGSVTDGYKALQYAIQQSNDVFNQQISLLYIIFISDSKYINSNSAIFPFNQNFLYQKNINLLSFLPVSISDNNGNNAIVMDYQNKNVLLYTTEGCQSLNEEGIINQSNNNSYTYYGNLTQYSNGLTLDINSLIQNQNDTLNCISNYISNRYINGIFTSSLALPENPMPVYLNYQENRQNINIYIPSTDREACVHPRITFYRDAAMTSVVSSSFSMIDQRRWFLNKSSTLCPMTTKGAALSYSNSTDIYYNVEVLPLRLEKNRSLMQQYLTSNSYFPLNIYNFPQISNLILSDTIYGVMQDFVYDSPLQCGVTYYVSIDLFYSDTKTFENYITFSYNFDFNMSNDCLWRENYDSKNWICSGQGKEDFYITKSSFNSNRAKVSSNFSGQFLITWQDYRFNQGSINEINNNSQSWYCIYDSNDDVLWSSGQNKYDYYLGANNYRPLINTDPCGNFNITGYYNTGLNYFVGPVSAITNQSNTYWSDNRFIPENLSYISGDSSPVANVDVSNLLYFVSSGYNKKIPVVTESIIKLNIQGVKNAYAIRQMNENEDRWSAWMNIDAGKNNDPSTATYQDNNYFNNEDQVLYARYIGDDFIQVPWILSAGNGNKKVNIEVMTVVGVTEIFNIEILKNQEDIKYKLSYYQSFSNNTFSNQLEIYDGKYVASAQYSPIHMKIEYEDIDKINKTFNLIKSLNKYANYFNVDSNNNIVPSFSLIQQGINHIFNKPTEYVSNGIYHGTIDININDGVFNIDGLASLIIETPDPSTMYKKLYINNNIYDTNTNNYYSMRNNQFIYNTSPENINQQYVDNLYFNSSNNVIKELIPYDQTYSASYLYENINNNVFNNSKVEEETEELDQMDLETSNNNIYEEKYGEVVQNCNICTNFGSFYTGNVSEGQTSITGNSSYFLLQGPSGSILSDQFNNIFINGNAVGIQIMVENSYSISYTYNYGTGLTVNLPISTEGHKKYAIICSSQEMNNPSNKLFTDGINSYQFTASTSGILGSNISQGGFSNYLFNSSIPNSFFSENNWLDINNNINFTMWFIPFGYIAYLNINNVSCD